MVDFEKRCSYLEGELRHINERILNWIREHEFTQHQGGYQLHADDMEEYVKKLLQVLGRLQNETFILP